MTQDEGRLPRERVPGGSGGRAARSGRARAGARLVRAFAAEEGFATLVLEGEAGIGKTTLLRQAVAAASGAGAGVLMAWPAAAEAQPAFSGLGDLLAGALDELVSELPAPQARALDIALLRRQAGERPVDPHAVSAGVLSALRILAERSAVVVAVDDVQWLDRATANALAFAFRRLGDERVRLVGSLRLDRPLMRPDLIESLPPERVVRLPIGSMSTEALHRLIQLHTGRTVPRPVLQRIREVTDGNPFYALQLVQSLPEHESGAALQMPPPVEALTSERLARLQRPVRRLLEPAALLRDPTVGILEALSTEPGRVGERLDRAVAAGVVEISSDRVRFAHPLLAEGMATMIGPRRRRELHGDLARLVEDPEQRARHPALATSPAPRRGGRRDRARRPSSSRAWCLGRRRRAA